ncbi:hypothetical protein QTO34_001199 [Cnephaeus nilssonii]|uniref:Ras-related protein Rab n=1 Tax=Cnephaeus nilssonii TaxID=3371016 RepID=A0AA40HVF0_CNENI|nr:hypothetical protein QTO34_001199 [Eptesicus nilssonii]
MAGGGAGDLGRGAAAAAAVPETREHLFKVLVIGELGVGKTSIIKRYVHQLFSQHYRATIGVDFALKVLNWDSRTLVRLQLWDIAGERRPGRGHAGSPRRRAGGWAAASGQGRPPGSPTAGPRGQGTLLRLLSSSGLGLDSPGHGLSCARDGKEPSLSAPTCPRGGSLAGLSRSFSSGRGPAYKHREESREGAGCSIQLSPSERTQVRDLPKVTLLGSDTTKLETRFFPERFSPPAWDPRPRFVSETPLCKDRSHFQEEIATGLDKEGQERFGNMTRVYYKEAVGAFVVFDISRGSTFEAVLKWKSDLDSKVHLPNGGPIPAVLLANKCDQKKEGGQSPAQMDQFCKEHGFTGWFETSAKDNINIEEAARFLVENILTNHRSFPNEDNDGDKIKLHQEALPAESKSQLRPQPKAAASAHPDDTPSQPGCG